MRKNKYILFLIDIDNFKETNDSHGHDAGDNLLRELTEYLERFFGAEAQIFRLGGDEFVVLRRFYDHESIEIISSDLNKSSKNKFYLSWSSDLKVFLIWIYHLGSIR